MFIGEIDEADADLMEIVDALEAPCAGLCLGQCWQEQRRQHGDDPHDTQQLDEGHPPNADSGPDHAHTLPYAASITDARQNRCIVPRTCSAMCVIVTQHAPRPLPSLASFCNRLHDLLVAGAAAEV